MQFPDPAIVPGRVSAAAYLAVGDGVVDDRAHINAGLAAAIAAGAEEYWLEPNKTYNISAYLDASFASGLRIRGNNTRIRYPSADIIATDGVALTAQSAASAILLRNASNVTIEGITFVGDLLNNDLVNQGGGTGIFARSTVNLKILNCHQIGGISLLSQQYTHATNGTASVFAYSGGIVTMTASSGTFTAGAKRRFVHVTGAPSALNNGMFEVLSVPGASTITYANANGVSESGGTGTWTLDDDERRTSSGRHPASGLTPSLL